MSPLWARGDIREYEQKFKNVAFTDGRRHFRASVNPRDGLLRRVGNLARFDLMVNRGRVGRSGPVPMWRVWFVGFVISVVGATAVSAAWHAEHDTDPSCVVCKVRHQPLAKMSGDLQVGSVDAAEPATSAPVTAWIPTDPDAHVPTRAPPLS